MVTLEAKTMTMLTLEPRALTKMGDASNWKGFKTGMNTIVWTTMEHR